jgi:hypothetical protein
MSRLLESSSWVLYAFLVMAIAILFCWGILILVRRYISIKELKKSHDVVGFTFSIIGVLYSVILGFTVINVQDRYNAVSESIHTEAILLADLYQDAAFFPPDTCKIIRASLRSYINHVIEEEWGIYHDKTIHYHTRNIIKGIWDSYYAANPENEKEFVWYRESISKLNSFLNARLARQFNSWEHLGGMMWSLLIAGAAVTICFMFFFGLENWGSHMLMTALLAGYLSFMLFLVYSLDHVFKGPQAIKPTALEQVVTVFDLWDQDYTQ